MKYVLNQCFGGFTLPDEYLESLNQSYDQDDVRTDPKLIEIVEHPNYEGELTVVTIPDDITDTYLWEYDGAETLLYVKDGKIYEA